MYLADVVPELAGLDVASLCSDSRKAMPGAVFFALSGKKTDGARFAQAAVNNGAIAVVSESDAPPAFMVPWRKIRDARAVLARACRRFYGRDVATTRYAGVTGTNGKTTLSYLLEAIFGAAGERPAVLGTIAHRFGERSWSTEHTTPDAISLCERIVELEAAGATCVVMEVSSHGLDQRRVDALRFSVAGFTNLTPDHLDYHGTMEAYFATKARLMEELLSAGGAGVVNIDDAYGARMLQQVRGRALSVSRKAPADIRVVRSESTGAGTQLALQTPLGELQLKSRLVGTFNVENTALAVGMAIGAGLALETISRGVEKLYGVPGRLESVRAADGRLGFVDYAHTPDALARVLETLREVPHDRIICVFGCGGDRDRSKRPLMAEVVARLADVAVLSSDNPRTEAPEAILDEVAAGFAERRYECFIDRREAIRFAAHTAKARDIVLIAGKGHENYQIIGTTKYHFDDKEELALAFAEERV